MNTEEITQRKCFYITPIGEKESLQYKKLEGIEDNVLKPVLEQEGYELEIAHTIHLSGSISDQIFSRIVSSELVIVNLTGLNPNVMYELAVRHSVDKPCIMICESSTKLPFDLISDRTIFYEDTIKGSGELKNELIKKIKASNDSKIDNPVTRAVSKLEVLKNNSSDPLILVLSKIESLDKRLERFEKNSTNDFRSLDNSTQPIFPSGDIDIDKFLMYFRQLFTEGGIEETLKEVAREMNISHQLAITTYEKMKIFDLI